MHTAKSPLGPWEPHVIVIQNWTNTSWNLGNWNPAPVMLPDGKVRVMAHTDNVGWAGETVLEAPTYKGPYTVKTRDDLDHCGFCEEDPFMWYALSLTLLYTHSFVHLSCTPSHTLAHSLAQLSRTTL
jgi:hypothetical protein